jgi:ABC-2 type transport system ATP-binding protein
MSEKSGVIVEVKELVKNFGNLAAVDKVSFDVNRGEIFGFLGPNGAGKTTTISMLCTLLRPTAGTALVNGFDVIEQKNEVRESIGLVFQDPSLDDRLTARENLEFHAVVYHVPRSVREERIKEVLDMVSLWDRAEDWVETFSGGMKRRLEIARGLLHYPKVLFLDEPTIGLDPQTRNYIWEYIEDLKKREGITIFLTTHYMEEAEHCDRIGIIDLGKIIALDSPENLKSRVGGDIIKLKTADDDEAREEPGVQALLRDGQRRGVHPHSPARFRHPDRLGEHPSPDARRRVPQADGQGDKRGRRRRQGQHQAGDDEDAVRPRQEKAIGRWSTRWKKVSRSAPRQ